MDGIWETIRQRVEYATFVPRPVPDFERADLRRRDGTPYTMLKNPRGARGAGLYVRLEPEDVALFELMDGSRTIQDILVKHLEQSGVFALARLARLTAALSANGFFGEERPRVYERLALQRALRDPLTRLSLGLRRLITWDVARWSNADAFVRRVYGAGGWLAFTRVGAILIGLLCVAGVYAWVSELRAGRHVLVKVGDSYVLAILVLLVLQVLSVTIHEAGHALAITHYGRRVRRLGLAIYYLFPCVYVDSTDMAMSTRKARIVVSLAGPIGGLTVAALCAFVAAADGGIAGSLAYRAAFLLIFQFAMNMLPILELDGYYVLSDLLDAPMLRARAMVFARGGVMRKIRRRERWSPSEVGLAVYGALAIATSLVMIAFSLGLWESRVGATAGELLAIGPAGLVILAVLVIVFIGPLLLALVARVLGWGRSAARASAARARQAKQAILIERARALGRVPFLIGLNGPALLAIASHLRDERVEAGATVVTIGEPGDRFYVIRTGRLEALNADGTVRGALAPGDGFGELALLDHRPRGATVRATEDSELWSLDRGHFHRWVAERYEVAGRIRASVDERDTLARLPFFAGLDAMELSRIAARMRTERVPAGDAVFAEGERADRYYVIRSGEAEIRTAAGDARRIGPGEGFGEMGLLYGRPRGATVVAASDLVVATIERSDFAALVRASGETVGEFRARTAHYLGAGLAGAVGGG